jgi:hypothetical protein
MEAFTSSLTALSLLPETQCGIFFLPSQTPIKFAQIHQDFTLIFEEQ